MRGLAAPGFVGLPEPWASVVIGILAIVVITWIAILVNVLKMVVRSRLDLGMKVAWIALVMSSHPLGVLLWFFVGRRQDDRLKGRTEAG